MAFTTDIPSPARGPARHGGVQALDVRTGDVLFIPGTEKQCLYWVQNGQVELRWPSQSGGSDQLELLGPGDYFAIGFLGYHVGAATAVMNSLIHQLPRSAAPTLSEMDPNFAARDAVETQREFAHRREMMVASASSQPLCSRVAAFLGVLSRFNAYEGRDPLLLSNDVTGPVVAAYFDTEVVALEEALNQLQDLGAIEFAPPDGLRIRDLELLERIETVLPGPVGA